MVCSLLATTAYADIVITADTMRYDQKQKQSFADGNAKIVDGEGTDQKTLTADKIEALHNTENDTNDSVDLGGGSIKSAKAIGHVKMVAGERTVTADSCEYEALNQKLICKGNVSIQSPKEHLTGDVGTADLKTQVYKIEKAKTSDKQSKAIVQTKRS